MWLIFGGFIPGVLIGAIANWAAKHRKLAEMGSKRHRRLLWLEVVTTILATLAIFIVGITSFFRIGTV